MPARRRPPTGRSAPPRKPVRPGKLPRADFDVLLVVGLEKGSSAADAAPFEAWWQHYALEFLEVATLVSARSRVHPVLGKPDDVYVLTKNRSPLDARSADGSLRSMFQDFKDEHFKANLILVGKAGPVMAAVARDATEAGIKTFVLDEQTTGNLARVHAAGARAVRYDPEHLLARRSAF